MAESDVFDSHTGKFSTLGESGFNLSCLDESALNIKIHIVALSLTHHGAQ
jgi:hypothetical protein